MVRILNMVCDLRNHHRLSRLLHHFWLANESRRRGRGRNPARLLATRQETVLQRSRVALNELTSSGGSAVGGGAGGGDGADGTGGGGGGGGGGSGRTIYEAPSVEADKLHSDQTPADAWRVLFESTEGKLLNLENLAQRTPENSDGGGNAGNGTASDTAPPSGGGGVKQRRSVGGHPLASATAKRQSELDGGGGGGSGGGELELDGGAVGGGDGLDIEDDDGGSTRSLLGIMMALLMGDNDEMFIGTFQLLQRDLRQERELLEIARNAVVMRESSLPGFGSLRDCSSAISRLRFLVEVVGRWDRAEWRRTRRRRRRPSLFATQSVTPAREPNVVTTRVDGDVGRRVGLLGDRGAQVQGGRDRAQPPRELPRDGRAHGRRGRRRREWRLPGRRARRRRRRLRRRRRVGGRDLDDRARAARVRRERAAPEHLLHVRAARHPDEHVRDAARRRRVGR